MAELTRAMQIGRQSLYDTFGDKWRLYLEALARDVAADGAAHRAALSTGPRALKACLMRCCTSWAGDMLQRARA